MSTGSIAMNTRTDEGSVSTTTPSRVDNVSLGPLHARPTAGLHRCQATPRLVLVSNLPGFHDATFQRIKITR